MAKWKRTQVGSVVMNKDASKGPAVKITEDVVLKKGTYLNLENDKSILKGLQDAADNDRMPSDLIEKIRESTKQAPWYKERKDKDGNVVETKGFLLWNIVRLEKQE